MKYFAILATIIISLTIIILANTAKVNNLVYESFSSSSDTKDNRHKNKNKDNKKHGFENVKFPFKNIKDQDSRNTNVVGIVAPFRNNEHREQYKSLKKKVLSLLE